MIKKMMAYDHRHTRLNRETEISANDDGYIESNFIFNLFNNSNYYIEYF